MTSSPVTLKSHAQEFGLFDHGLNQTYFKFSTLVLPKSNCLHKWVLKYRLDLIQLRFNILGSKTPDLPLAEQTFPIMYCASMWLPVYTCIVYVRTLTHYIYIQV